MMWMLRMMGMMMMMRMRVRRVRMKMKMVTSTASFREKHCVDVLACQSTCVKASLCKGNCV